MSAEGHHEVAVFLSPIPNLSSVSNYPKKSIYHHNNNHSSYVDGVAGGTAASRSGDPLSLDGQHQDQQHRYFFQNMFSSNTVLGEGQGHAPDYSHNSALLAPPPQHDLGRRRSSNSSLDSYSFVS